jgi:hypothetical protein
MRKHQSSLNWWSQCNPSVWKGQTEECNIKSFNAFEPDNDEFAKPIIAIETQGSTLCTSEMERLIQRNLKTYYTCIVSLGREKAWFKRSCFRVFHSIS